MAHWIPRNRRDGSSTALDMEMATSQAQPTHGRMYAFGDESRPRDSGNRNEANWDRRASFAGHYPNSQFANMPYQPSACHSSMVGMDAQYRPSEIRDAWGPGTSAGTH